MACNFSPIQTQFGVLLLSFIMLTLRVGFAEIDDEDIDTDDHDKHAISNTNATSPLSPIPADGVALPEEKTKTKALLMAST